MFSTIDLFAGAGGLSAGFENSGQFKILAAVEKNENAKATYHKNFPVVKLYDDIQHVDFVKMQEELGRINVIIGGPPCQGFSNANRQNSNALNQNNMMVKEYVRAIREIRPDAFVMENVGMLKSDVHYFFETQKDYDDIEHYNVPMKVQRLFLIEKKYLSGSIDRFFNEAFVDSIMWNLKEFQVLYTIYRTRANSDKCYKRLNKHKHELMLLVERLKNHRMKLPADICNYENRVINAIQDFFNDNQSNVLRLILGIEPTIHFQKMLQTIRVALSHHLIVRGYSEENDKYYLNIRACSVVDYIKNILESDEMGYQLTSGILKAEEFGVPQKRRRFVIIGVKRNIKSSDLHLPTGKYAGKRYFTVQEAIGDLANESPVYDASESLEGQDYQQILPQSNPLLDYLRNGSQKLFNHLISKTGDIAMERFMAIEPGQNFHSLDPELRVNTYTNTERTQNTIYLRLDPKQPSRTVLNVRKSMWIHPTKNRGVSVREAARLQSFQDTFIFEGSKDSQFQQVGNAVPPLMARGIAEYLASLLNKN